MKKLTKFAVPGFLAGAVEAAIKKPGRPDLALIYSETPAVSAAVFTKNSVKAAPVLLDIEVAKKMTARAIVANSGNANACTGARGMKDALTTAHLTAEALNVDTSDVFVCSTGVIGNPMPMDRVKSGIKKLPAALSAHGWEAAAGAIMTTDTAMKLCGVKCNIGGADVSIVGIVKGSGMINPDMATMLCFVATNAAIERPVLKAALKDSVDTSFNCITVDGDTSTNDTVIVLANGLAYNPVVKKGTGEYAQFKAALDEVLSGLAKMIVKDGEGATKFVEVEVTGAKDQKDAAKAAKAIANSPLVKTALFAADPNWGRIICAAGYSGAQMAPDSAEVWFDRVCMVKGGVGQGTKAEAKAAKVMKKPEYRLTVKLGTGAASARVYTTDLSYEYVKINAEYRS